MSSPPSFLKDTEREKLEDIPFAVRARVAMQLGRESISSSIVAIVELVKNAYDADAENVWITFSNLDSPETSLIISDDGTGMTTKQIKDRWMIIGTDYKAIKRRSGSKTRTLVGEKGLGRLGLDRLAAITRLQSFSEEQLNCGTELEIVWGKYEERSSDPLDSIKHTLYSIPKGRSNGTDLSMIGLKDNWTPESLKDLRKDLSLLLSPFSEINDFKIWLNGESVISSELLDAADWKLVTELVYANDSEEWVVRRHLTDPEGRQSTTIIEWVNRDGQKQNSCGPVSFEMLFFPRGDLKNVEGEKLFTRGQVIDFLEANQGIRIYRDGFRVKPYGDPAAAGEGDWLGLNMRRVRHPSGVIQEGRWRVAYNQVVGAVFITKDSNPKLIDQTNREGLVEGESLADLRTFALNAVEFFEERRQIYERSRNQLSAFETASQDAEKASEEAIKTVEKAEQAIQTLEVQEKMPPGNSQPDSSLAEVLEYVTKLRSAVEDADRAREDMRQAYRDRERSFEEKENTLANLASLGILAAFFGHETVGYTNSVINNVSLLKDILLDVARSIEKAVIQELYDVIARIEDGSTRIQTFAKFTIGNVRTDKRHRKLASIDRIAQDVIKSFELSQRNINVMVEASRGRLPQIYAFRIDWESIFINLLTNAVWALDGTEGDRRSILLRFWSDERSINITFDDGGKGIEPGTIDRVFEATFSTRRNARGDVVGTGMGLSIVQSLVSNYQGSIKVNYNGELGGAHFHITIPLKPNTRERKNGKRS